MLAKLAVLTFKALGRLRRIEKHFFRGHGFYHFSISLFSSAKLSKGLFTQAVFHIRTTCTTGRLDKSELSIQERTGNALVKTHKCKQTFSAIKSFRP